MKKLLIFILFILCGQQLQAATDPYFGIKKSHNIFGIPETEIFIGPFKYKANIIRALRYFTQCCSDPKYYLPMFPGGEWESNASPQDIVRLSTARNALDPNPRQPTLPAYETVRDGEPIHHLTRLCVKMRTKEFVSQLITDIACDSIKPYTKTEISNPIGANITQVFVDYAVRFIIYNVVRNGMDGYQELRSVKVPLVEITFPLSDIWMSSLNTPGNSNYRRF